MVKEQVAKACAISIRRGIEVEMLAERRERDAKNSNNNSNNDDEFKYILKKGAEKLRDNRPSKSDH